MGGINVAFHFPEHPETYDEQKIILENAALTCPIAKIIHPEIEPDVKFNW